jgi:hypothetical protein
MQANNLGKCGGEGPFGTLCTRVRYDFHRWAPRKANACSPVAWAWIGSGVPTAEVKMCHVLRHLLPEIRPRTSQGAWPCTELIVAAQCELTLNDYHVVPLSDASLRDWSFLLNVMIIIGWVMYYSVHSLGRLSYNRYLSAQSIGEPELFSA